MIPLGVEKSTCDADIVSPERKIDNSVMWNKTGVGQK
jgi:hypothetical protein